MLDAITRAASKHLFTMMFVGVAHTTANTVDPPMTINAVGHPPRFAYETEGRGDDD